MLKSLYILANGYCEIQSPPKRYRIVDRVTLASLLGLKDVTRLQGYYHRWIEEALSSKESKRQGVRSEGVAVGSQHYVEGIMAQRGIKATGRPVYHEAGLYQVREPEYAYKLHFDGEMAALSDNKGHFSLE